MHRRKISVLLSFLVLPTVCKFGVAQPSISGELYNEDLFMRPLHDGRVVAAFTFTTVLLGATPRDPRDSERSAHHHSLFPLTLGQILHEYSITDLHLTMNSGKWNYDHWGLPDDPNVGTGAELWAWMADGAALTIDERWTGLRNALAGHFCASLGSLDAQRTSSPLAAFPLSSPHSTPHALRYASLPSEHVCTENLTPFVKLLPCKTRAGLATLLTPQRIFDADWHGLSVHVQSTQRGVELKLGVQAVFDPVRLSGGMRRDWSFRMLFDRIIDASCPVASLSMVRVKAPDGQSHTLSPATVVDASSIAVYNLTAYVPLDVSLSWPHEHSFQYSLPLQSLLTPLSIKRTLYGSSQTHGLLSLALTNNVYYDITVGYFESLPALVTLWAHTMTAEVNGTRRDSLISDISYHPHQILTNGQRSPSTLQATLTIPAKSTLRLSMEVSKAFLKYTEHPPDAMRGWDLPPAVFFPVHLSVNSTHETQRPIMGIAARMYTPSLLIDLPTPDFSMPYNVIILSCTLITLIFGSVFNLLIRRWVIVPLEGNTSG